MESNAEQIGRTDAEILDETLDLLCNLAPDLKTRQEAFKLFSESINEQFQVKDEEGSKLSALLLIGLGIKDHVELSNISGFPIDFVAKFVARCSLFNIWSENPKADLEKWVNEPLILVVDALVASGALVSCIINGEQHYAAASYKLKARRKNGHRFCYITKFKSIDGKIQYCTISGKWYDFDQDLRVVHDVK